MMFAEDDDGVDKNMILSPVPSQASTSSSSSSSPTSHRCHDHCHIIHDHRCHDHRHIIMIIVVMIIVTLS